MESEDFLRAGVLHYRQAYDTVKYFSNQMERRLAELLRGKHDWRTFEPSKANSAVRAKTGRNASDGRWIFASLQGRTKVSEGVAAIGLWWGPHSVTGHEVILYANYDGTEELAKHPFESATKGVLAAPAPMGSYTRLYMPPPKDLDLERDFGLLLAELDRHAGACACALHPQR